MTTTKRGKPSWDLHAAFVARTKMEDGERRGLSKSGKLLCLATDFGVYPRPEMA
jgi:hypothetical protein